MPLLQQLGFANVYFDSRVGPTRSRATRRRWRDPETSKVFVVEAQPQAFSATIN
jgi:hypothetical protein